MEILKIIEGRSDNLDPDTLKLVGTGKLKT